MVLLESASKANPKDSAAGFFQIVLDWDAARTAKSVQPDWLLCLSSRLEESFMPQRNPGILDGNPFKMGLFGSNCSGGLSFTTLPERWEASWENNAKLAQLADEAGFECMVPIARWKGFGGATNVNGTSFETITWACGLL